MWQVKVNCTISISLPLYFVMNYAAVVVHSNMSLRFFSVLIRAVLNGVDRNQLLGQHVKERTLNLAVLTHVCSRLDIIKRYPAAHDKKGCSAFAQHMELYLQM